MLKLFKFLICDHSNVSCTQLKVITYLMLLLAGVEHFQRLP